MVSIMEQGDNVDHRRWTLVFLLGFLLHIYAAFHSDLGLDAHVRLNALNDGIAEEQDLTWGSPRISGTTSINTNTVYDGYIPPWNTSEGMMKITAITSLVLVATLASLRPRDHPSRLGFEPNWGALLMLSPVLLFSTSRGYDEAPLALLMGLGVVGFWFNRGETAPQQRLNGVLMATSVLLVMVWKGFSPMVALSVWLVMLTATEIWLKVLSTGRYTSDGQFLANPWSVGGLTFGVVYIGITCIGLFSETGTFSIIADRPILFLFASVFALLDTAVLYLLIGCLLWPHLVQRWQRLRSARGPGLTMLVVYISALLAGLVAYVASLWTLEATLWNMSLTKVMILLGNNGRYATLLLLPLVALLRWNDDEVETDFPSEARLSIRAVAVVLPFLLFTTLVGHQIWSEDAGELLTESWREGDDMLLLVAPESMAMHHLYVLKSNLDLDGSQSIQGLWATPDAASELVDTYQHTLDYVVVAPGTSIDFNSTSWTLLGAYEVPVSVPGGIQGGTWTLYRLPT